VDFIRQRIARELEEGAPGSAVVTRFPPEPNGYLHIGHAKSVCLNFGVAQEFDGRCYMRFDDTNPERETMEYVRAILEDVRWLGFDWEDRLTHASDYFQALYDYAEDLVRQGKAYVDSLSAEQIREYRGTLTEPGRDSPHRDRDVAENLALLRDMRDGRHEPGEHVLRARIDMASPNLNMRDPVMYRILNRPHQMAGDRWAIYPMYDFAHCVSDALEGITHSLCTLEFEDHRPLYDWFLDQLDVPCHPAQIEFSRLSLSYTVMSKRLLNALVTEGHVQGWDDPRMPTISGLRRRGFTPASIRDFCRRIGISKSENNVELAVLENCIREDLDRSAPRAMAVLDPLKVVIENYPEDREEKFDAANHPGNRDMGTRNVPFSRELWIERGDFMEDPPRKFFRLAPGREVRLRYAYYITCNAVIRDPASGAITELRCSYDPQTRGGDSPDGRKVRGTLHWVSARHAVPATVRLYDTLFSEPDPGAARHGGDWTALLNPASLQVLEECMLEPSLALAAAGERFQFERTGYFCVDPDTTGGSVVFNRTVGLRDSWARVKGKGGG
jgi:glutaminyl-tRNA synthetase